MQAQNVEEYKEIRKELTDLKNCVTTYTGFALGGSATASWGLAARASDKDLTLAMAFRRSSLRGPRDFSPFRTFLQIYLAQSLCGL
jgi:hypothetical protein